VSRPTPPMSSARWWKSSMSNSYAPEAFSDRRSLRHRRRGHRGMPAIPDGVDALSVSQRTQLDHLIKPSALTQSTPRRRRRDGKHPRSRATPGGGRRTELMTTSSPTNLCQPRRRSGRQRRSRSASKQARREHAAPVEGSWRDSRRQGYRAEWACDRARHSTRRACRSLLRVSRTGGGTARSSTSGERPHPSFWSTSGE
jgi:hypothetical protein